MENGVLGQVARVGLTYINNSPNMNDAFMEQLILLGVPVKNVMAVPIKLNREYVAVAL